MKDKDRNDYMLGVGGFKTGTEINKIGLEHSRSPIWQCQQDATASSGTSSGTKSASRDQSIFWIALFILFGFSLALDHFLLKRDVQQDWPWVLGAAFVASIVAAMTSFGERFLLSLTTSTVCIFLGMVFSNIVTESKFPGANEVWNYQVPLIGGAVIGVASAFSERTSIAIRWITIMIMLATLAALVLFIAIGVYAKMGPG